MTLHEFPTPGAWIDAMVAGWEALGGPALKARGTFNVYHRLPIERKAEA